jgi:adenylosuccinate synthase
MTDALERRHGVVNVCTIIYPNRSELRVCVAHSALDTLENVGICTGYMIDGELHTDFPGDLVMLEGAKPEYEWIKGWQRSTAEARSLSDLPVEARAYLDRIEQLVEAPIKYVSVGTRRDQIIPA